MDDRRSARLPKKGDSYLPVVRCVAARVCPARPCPASAPPCAPPRAGNGVRRRRRRSAGSSGPSSTRSASVFGWTVRNTGPRRGSTTATTTLRWLGRSKTIPSRAAPPSATFTSWPTLVDSTDGAYSSKQNAHSSELLVGSSTWTRQRRRRPQDGPFPGRPRRGTESALRDLGPPIAKQMREPSAGACRIRSVEPLPRRPCGGDDRRYSRSHTGPSRPGPGIVGRACKALGPRDT